MGSILNSRKVCQSPNSHRIKLIDFGLARYRDRQIVTTTPIRRTVRVLFWHPGICHLNSSAAAVYVMCCP